MTYPFTTLTDRKHLADSLLEWIESTFADFKPIKADYAAAMSTLTEQLGADAVRAEARAIERQMLSDLLFCGWLGFKANLDHFQNPVAQSFMDVDFEVFLQETVAHSLPDYEDAQDSRNRFFAALDEAQKNTYHPITTYFCYLETTVPKLAHYFGYLLGNDLLPQLVPGYQPDLVQTLGYRRMLEDYLAEGSLPAAL